MEKILSRIGEREDRAIPYRDIKIKVAMNLSNPSPYVFAHEVAHLMGLPDLYTYGGVEGPKNPAVPTDDPAKPSKVFVLEQFKCRYLRGKASQSKALLRHHQPFHGTACSFRAGALCRAADTGKENRHGIGRRAGVRGVPCFPISPTEVCTDKDEQVSDCHSPVPRAGHRRSGRSGSAGRPAGRRT